METPGAALQGVYRDILIGNDQRPIHDSGWVSNTIVDRGRILLAGFLRNDSSNGIQFLAVGQGLEAWDTSGTPPAEATATDLVNRYTPTIPVADLSVVYLDESDAVVEGPTNRLQITATLEAGYPAIQAPAVSYPLREFGLFGAFNGTDYMVNCVRHPVINKDASATLVRVIRLYF